MSAFSRRATAFLVIIFGLSWLPAAQADTNRVALVIGNGSYQSGPLATAPNDAGLVAQTLTAAGFEVSGARDLDGDSLRRAFRDFLARAAQVGPDGLAFVYLAGYGVQYQGENYFVPVDATLARDSDVPIQAIRLSDLTRALAGLPLQGRVVVLDGAYRNTFPAAANLSGGLALVDPEMGSLLAYNAAPGTLGPSSTESYGVYGQALAEMLREGGIPVQEVFDRVRLRVNDITKGVDVPWSSSKLAGSFVFLQRSPDAPPPSPQQVTYEQIQRRPLREFPVAEAYTVAVARDTFEGYQDFLTAYPGSPYGARIRGLLAARREALSWRRTVNVGTDRAYWSYLQRYSKGPHAREAQRRLRELSVALAPPPDFDPIEYDVPPPPEDEYRYVDAPIIEFDEPDYGPPPPPPVYFLPAQPEESVYELPPPPPPEPGFLPIPVPIPIPFARAPASPGRLQPVQGVVGTYAQPQPFIQNPQGGLTPRVGPAPIAVPQRQSPPLLPPGQPGQPGQPLNPLNGLARPGLPPVPPGTLPRALPNLPGNPGVVPRAQQLLQQRQLPPQPLPMPGAVPPNGALRPTLPQTLPGTQPAPQHALPNPPGNPGLTPRAQQLLQQRQLPSQQQPLPGQAPGTTPSNGVARPTLPPAIPGTQPSAPRALPNPAAVPQAQQLLQQRQLPPQRQPQPQPGLPRAIPVPAVPTQQQQLQQRQQLDQQRQQQQQRQLIDQQRQQLQQKQQIDQQRQQQQQRQQIDQQRQQQQQRQLIDQQRQQQQQRQQIDQQRQQQQQRQLIDQQRQQQQQRQQIDQQRQQQQQRLQIDQQRQQQQQEQQRQAQPPRPQINPQLLQQRAPQVPQQGRPPAHPPCGLPGLPPCR